MPAPFGEQNPTEQYVPMDHGIEVEGEDLSHATPIVEPVAPAQPNSIFRDDDTAHSAPIENITADEEGPVIVPPHDEDPIDHKGFPRWIIALMGVVLLLIFVGGLFLFFNKSVTSEKVTLSYWGLWEDESFILPIIQSYQKSHPGVTIQYEKKSPQDYREKVQVQIKDGRGPDIFRFHNTWVPMYKDILAAIPGNVMSAEEFGKTFYQVAVSDLKVNNSIVGIPLEIDGLVLLYNADSFDKIGLVNPPRTWDELINYAQQLSVPDQNGDLITAGVALGTADNIEHFSDILGWMFLQNGADIKDLTSKEAEEVLQKYREFTEEPFHVWDAKMPNSINAFAQGKVAMIFAPSWEVATIKAINPELKIKVASLPLLPGEDTPLSISNYWVEGVSAASKHQEQAWDFLKYLSSRDQLTILYKNQSQVRNFGEPYSRLDLGTTIASDPYIAPIVAQGPFMKSLPVISRTYDNGLNDEIVVYLKNAVNDSIKGVSYSQALQTAHTGIQSVLEKYNIN